MKLNYDKKSKNPTYFIQHGYRVGNKSTTKNVYRIGKHSDLLKITDDPLAYAKEITAKYNEEYKKEHVVFNIPIDLSESVLNDGIVVAKSKNLNIGYLYLQQIYHDLRIKDFIDKIVSDTKITFNCDDINRFITFFRILDPCSKLSMYDKKEIYFEQPNFQYHQILRFLTLLSEHFDDYIAHLYKYSNKVVDRNTTICYYDCTNYHFEIEYEDDDYVDDVTGEILDGFRRYAVSKQHQPAPLVEMGLFMDKDGIPISMCIDRGNKSEQLTAVPTEKKMLKTFDDKNIIYCADAGLGSYKIRLYNSTGKRAFIVTQSIKKLSKPLQEAVFNDFDYKLLSNDNDITIKELKEFDRFDKDNLTLYNDHAYKVIEASKLMDLGIDEIVEINGRTVKRKAKGELKQYVIVTFSRKMMEYQRKIRNKQIERAKNLIKNNKVEDLKKNQNDPKRFIKKKGKGKDSYEIDEDKIKEEEKYDGYYAIATNLDAEDNAKKIFEINSQRYKIEDCFRTLKTYFKARPVGHRLPERIEAHFLTCYTALLILRILEKKLNDNNTHFTTKQIIDNLRNMNVVNNNDFYYMSTYEGGDLCKALSQIYDLELDKKYYVVNELNKKIKKIIK